jgi:hypothetical protein
MDKLIVTSNILYSKDIYDKTKELNKMKIIYKTPRVFFNTFSQWNITKTKLLDDISNEINILIDKEYIYMYYHGMTVNLKKYLNKMLLTKLSYLTKNEQWSDNISNILVNGIESFIMGLVNTNTWSFFYNTIDKSKLKNIIYKNIEWQLCNDKCWPGILNNIPEFICNKCKKNDNYVNSNNICINCE